jgi:D-amino-acid dehydrogenase
MRIAVIGAGIIGITTAYELALDGHRGHRIRAPGRGSRGNQLCQRRPGRARLRHALGRARHAGQGPQPPVQPPCPRQARLPLSGSELAWMWKWFRACKLETYLANRARMQRLAFYSRERLHHLTAELELEYDGSPGYMVLLRSEKDSKLVQPGLAVLREAGVAFKEIGPEEVLKIEPALNTDTPFLGAVHLPNDEVANCRQFALLLKNEAQRIGVNFEFNTTVARLEPRKPPAF